ncbi:hypothetical protein SFRURICE_006221, partial [Spodoptera frugiperda]
MDAKLKELVKKRASCKAKLTLFSNYLNIVFSCSPLSDLQVTELETRLNKMDLVYNDYDKIQGDIELLMEDSTEALGDREAFQNQYFSLVSSAREVRRQHSKRRASVSVSSVQASDINDVTQSKHSVVKLPQITLPHFDGSYQHWLEFRDTFDSLIHKNTLLDDINNEPTTSNQITNNVTLTAKAIQNTTSSTVLLSTARVKVRDSSGRNHVARVLLDNGSTANFITEELCGKLGSLKRNVNSRITGINQQTCKSTQSCSLTLESYS